MFSLRTEKLIGTSMPLNSNTYIPMSSSLNQSNTHINIDFNNGIIEDFVPKGTQLNNIKKEIYVYDSVCGPTVDLLADLPFSDFTLTGISDKKVLDIYQNSLNELSINQMLRDIVVSYLVLGVYVGSLLFDEGRGIFTDLATHDIEYCDILPIPLSGYEPKVDMKVSPEMQKFIRSKDPRDREAQKEISSKLRAQILRGGSIPLEPMSTIVLERPSLPGITDFSYYSRVIPMWLIEKALVRGTIIGAWRRQRSILHVLAGNESWEPNANQLGELANLFISADQDPQGAVIVTRDGIETSEIRSGSDFWKVSDDWDVFATAKMRALGISDSFLSGEMSYNTLEISLSVFIEKLKALRAYITKKVFTEKIFLLLAKVHKFKKRKEVELTHHYRMVSKETTQSGSYLIPEITWHKQLSPESDREYVDLLSTAEEKGVPIPLRKIAAASGLEMDKVLESLDDDIKVRKQIAEYKNRLKKEIGGSGEENEEGGEEGMWSNFDEKIKQIADKIPDEMVLTGKQAGELLKKTTNIIPLKKEN